jgi:hypothetical protein
VQAEDGARRLGGEVQPRARHQEAGRHVAEAAAAACRSANTQRSRWWQSRSTVLMSVHVLREDSGTTTYTVLPPPAATGSKLRDVLFWRKLKVLSPGGEPHQEFCHPPGQVDIHRARTRAQACLLVCHCCPRPRLSETSPAQRGGNAGARTSGPSCCRLLR